MGTYILRRLLIFFPTLFGISLVTFLIVQLAPGDPVSMQSGGALSKQNAMTRKHLQQLREEYHLDEPVIQQFGRWLWRIIRLDFGNSLIDTRPVLDKIGERLPVTLFLNVMSFLLLFLISIPVGTYAALQRNRPFDTISGGILFMLYSLPVPWVALMLLVFVGVEWDLLPITGIVSNHFDMLGFFAKLADIATHALLPVICLTYTGLAFVSRITRTSVLETINKEFIRAAHARGIPGRRVLFRHSLKNALIPVITLFGALLPTLISGSVIIERIFSLPGIGQLFFESVLYRDYTTIMGLSFFSAVLTLAGILVADILYAVVDPRISYS